LSEENSSSGTPPPLPPKRRTRTQQLLDESEGLLASSLDRVSLRSRSPEDSSSLLSASAGSLDSALNHSRDEDEIRAIMGPNDESLNDSMDLSLMATIQGNICFTLKFYFILLRYSNLIFIFNISCMMRYCVIKCKKIMHATLYLFIN
jgi:hypothetical protein